MLHVVFALYRGSDVLVLLEINKAFQTVAFREACYSAHAVFRDAADQIIGNADIENAVWTICDDIDIAMRHRPKMKDVDGRDKPGHDG